MALTLELITNKFGRVVPNSPLHVVPIGFKVTGAISGSPTFEKSLNGVDWESFLGSTNYSDNYFGFVPEYVLPAGIYNFYVREVGNLSNTGSLLTYNVELDITSQGLHALGDTPKIQTTALEVGINRQIVINTSEPNKTVKVYGSETVSGQETFLFPYNPILEGTSDSNGLYIGTIPTVRQSQLFCASSLGEFQLESFSVNSITGGATVTTSKQLDININLVSTTVSGRNITVSVSGGSGNYSISKGINQSWSFAPNQQFELPFGRQYVLVKDNTTGAVFSKSIHIIPAGQQTITSIGLRSQFSNASNPNGNWSYGYIENGTYTAFNTFRDRGAKQGWGKDDFPMPMIGYGDNTTPLAADSIVLVPHTTADGSTTGYGITKACVRYTFDNAGVFNTTNLKLKKPTLGSLLSARYYLRYEVKFNDEIIGQGVLTTQNEEVSVPILNKTVQAGDIISITADSASDADTASPIFDELHVNFSGQLITTNYIAPLAPNAPTLANGTGGSTTEINQGQTVLIKTSPNENWILVYRNGIACSIIKTKLVSTENVFEFTAGVTGTYTFKAVSSGVFNSGAGVSINIKTSSATTPATPSVTSPTTISTGETVTINSTEIGTLQILKDGQLTASINIDTPKSVTYTVLSAGAYTFKLFRNGKTSLASTTVTAGTSAVSCSGFINDFALGTYTQNAIVLKVFSLNGITLIRQEFEGGFILRNGNFLKNNLVISDYKNQSSCFGFPKDDFFAALSESDLGKIQGYKWAISTDGYNVPYLLPDNTSYNTYRVCAKTPCDGASFLFAVSNTTNNPTALLPTDFKEPDGIIKVNDQNIEDVNGTNYYYKNFSLPAGVYNVFYKIKNNPNTPVKVVSQTFQ